MWLEGAHVSIKQTCSLMWYFACCIGNLTLKTVSQTCSFLQWETPSFVQHVNGVPACILMVFVSFVWTFHLGEADKSWSWDLNRSQHFNHFFYNKNDQHADHMSHLYAEVCYRYSLGWRKGIWPCYLFWCSVCHPCFTCVQLRNGWLCSSSSI